MLLSWSPGWGHATPLPPHMRNPGGCYRPPPKPAGLRQDASGHSAARSIGPAAGVARAGRPRAGRGDPGSIRRAWGRLLQPGADKAGVSRRAAPRRHSTPPAEAAGPLRPRRPRHQARPGRRIVRSGRLGAAWPSDKAVRSRGWDGRICCFGPCSPPPARAGPARATGHRCRSGSRDGPA
jgi:hypothetical protein